MPTFFGPAKGILHLFLPELGEERQVWSMVMSPIMEGAIYSKGFKAPKLVVEGRIKTYAERGGKY